MNKTLQKNKCKKIDLLIAFFGLLAFPECFMYANDKICNVNIYGQIRK